MGLPIIIRLTELNEIGTKNYKNLQYVPLFGTDHLNTTKKGNIYLLS